MTCAVAFVAMLFACSVAAPTVYPLFCFVRNASAFSAALGTECPALAAAHVAGIKVLAGTVAERAGRVAFVPWIAASGAVFHFLCYGSNDELLGFGIAAAAVAGYIAFVAKFAECCAFSEAQLAGAAGIAVNAFA